MDKVQIYIAQLKVFERIFQNLNSVIVFEGNDLGGYEEIFSLDKSFLENRGQSFSDDFVISIYYSGINVSVTQFKGFSE